MLLLTLAIALSLTACAGSQGTLADVLVFSPTFVTSATPATSLSAVPTKVEPSALPTAPLPLFPDINNVGSDWLVEVSDLAELGKEKT